MGIRSKPSVMLWILSFFLALAGRMEAGNAAPAAQSTPYAEIPWPTEGWQSATPESQGMDSPTLATAFDYIRQNHVSIHSLLIARNGKILLDASFYPFRDGQLHDLASVTKSVTCTLIGIAIGKNKLKGLRQPVLPLFPGRTAANRNTRKEQMTIEDLLTMTSGLDCSNKQHEITLRQMRLSKDWIQFMLDLPMAAVSGRKFEYCSGGMHLLSAILTQATGANALEFARSELFEPLGIHTSAWPADPDNNSYGWGDLHLLPRDMAKIGYLWLNQGRWKDRQLIPADWMRAASQVHSQAEWGTSYGYGLWVYPDRNPPIFEGLGRGGQRISVVPAKNLVVVFTGGGFEPGDIGTIIGQSIKSDTPLPENPTAFAALQAASRSAAQPPATQPVPVLPEISKSISGKAYALSDNDLGLKSLSLAFSKPSEATIILKFSDGRTEEKPIGLDGVPRQSPGSFDLPVFLQGSWEGSDTFVLDYDEAANINAYRFRMTFKNNSMSGEITERTGLNGTKLTGVSPR